MISAQTFQARRPINSKLIIAVVSLGLIILVVALASHSGTYNVALASSIQQSVPGDQQTSVVVQTQNQSATTNASTALVRIKVTDTSQYLSSEQYQNWYQSACSAIAMTELINAYGQHYRVGDILAVEIAIRAISQSQGLLAASGIDQTAQRFGFATQTLENPTLQQVLDVANGGKPVLISFPPQANTIWYGGHILVVKGGTLDAIQIADSSLVNSGNGLQTVGEAYMKQYWRGFAKVILPSSDLPSGLSFAKQYVKYAWDAAEKANISPWLFVRQINQESGFNPVAKSPAGAIGIGQFMPSTAAGIANPLGSGQLDPLNPEQALTAAALYMAGKNVRWGDYAKALAAYNAGDGGVQKAINKATDAGNADNWQQYLYQETKTYIQIILG